MKPENRVLVENGQKKTFLSGMMEPTLILSQRRARVRLAAKVGKPLKKSFKIAIFLINIWLVRNGFIVSGVGLRGLSVQI